jgi:threonine dehydrogenase-like Zn-dependent dehydrogenase
MRCEITERLGADVAIDIDDRVPVSAVDELTDGNGGGVVVEAVGGPAGADAFAEAQEIREGGLIQVLGLYEDEPLPLDSRAIQGKHLIGGSLGPSRRPEASDHGLELLASDAFGVSEMITRRFDPDDADAAFDLLYHRPEEALGVVFEWND